METSVLIAKIISVIYLSFGVGLIFNTSFYKKGIEKLLDSASFTILAGMIAVIIGIVIIEFHNIWEKNWTIVITIIGWIALIKGILLLTFPKSMVFFKPMFQLEKLYKFLAPLVILFGLIFAYFGFIK